MALLTPAYEIDHLLHVRLEGVVTDEAPVEKAFEAGKLLADKAKAAGVETVVFDRGGYKYHGRVKAFAEGARKGGLEF